MSTDTYSTGRASVIRSIDTDKIIKHGPEHPSHTLASLITEAKVPTIVYDTDSPEFMMLVGHHPDGACQLWNDSDEKFQWPTLFSVEQKSGTLNFTISNPDQHVIPLDRIRIAEVRREFRTTQPAPIDISKWRNRGSSEEEYRQKLTGVLHEIADDNDWCSEFDEAMESAGLEPRTREMIAEVEVTAEIEMSHPSAELDRALTSEAGCTIVTSSLRMTADVMVEVRYTGRPGDDPELEWDEVRDALERVLDTGSVEEIEDWIVKDTRRADD